MLNEELGPELVPDGEKMEDRKFSIAEILSDSLLHQKLFAFVASSHDLPDGGMYIPPRQFPSKVARRVRDMMTVLGRDKVTEVIDLAMATLYWAIGERLEGRTVGSADGEDDFFAAPLSLLNAIDSANFEK